MMCPVLLDRACKVVMAALAVYSVYLLVTV